MNYFKIAMVQHRSLGIKEIEKNTLCAVNFINEAKMNGADFVLFPECFLTSYYAPEVCKTLKPVNEIECHPDFIEWCANALNEDSRSIIQVCNAAKENKIGVGITAFTKGKKYPQNSVFFIDRNGQIIMKYSKVHTCDFDWERYIESGEAFHVCHFDGICMGAMICYDREYPESARELMLQGAELVLVPNDCDAMQPRLLELSVQAIQNMSGVAMANPPGINEGNSCAFHPIAWNEDCTTNDNTIIAADSTFDGIIYADFDMPAIRKYRENEYLGKNRKPAAYKHLLSAESE